MTPHGAYTQLKESAGRVKRLASEATDNVTVFYAAGPLPEDAALLDELTEMTKTFRELEGAVVAARNRVYALADRYLAENADKVVKDYKLAGHGRHIEGGRGE